MTVTDEDVDERLQELADRNSRLVSVDREAKDGDTAVIDFEGFMDGVPFEGGKGENYSLELGSHSFVPGFEEQVVGMKAGEEKDIDITFPEDYHPGAGRQGRGLPGEGPRGEGEGAPRPGRRVRQGRHLSSTPWTS